MDNNTKNTHMTQDKEILLIEDNPNDVDLTKRAFEKKNFFNKIVVAEDGEIALNYLFGIAGEPERSSIHIPSVILLDLKLPKISGFEVLQRIRSDPRTRRIPIVILTSSLEEIDLVASYDLGANSYIRKPVDFNSFADAIASLGLYWLVLNQPPPK
jgi:two-component system response regulator